MTSIIKTTGFSDLAKVRSHSELTFPNELDCYISMLTLIQLRTLKTVNSSNLKATPGPLSYRTLLFLPLGISVECVDYYHGPLPNLSSQIRLRN